MCACVGCPVSHYMSQHTIPRYSGRIHCMRLDSHCLNASRQEDIRWRHATNKHAVMGLSELYNVTHILQQVLMVLTREALHAVMLRSAGMQGASLVLCHSHLTADHNHRGDPIAKVVSPV